MKSTMGRIPLSVKNNYARNNHLKPDDGNVQVAIPRPNPLKLGIYGWGLFARRDIQEGEMVTY